MRVMFIYIVPYALWSAIIYLAPTDAAPIFDTTPLNITVMKGDVAVLPCTVRYINDRKVVWANERGLMLTLSHFRLVDDIRMTIERSSIHDWNLHIRNIQMYDAGEYSCKINTSPIQVKRISLTVYETSTPVHSTRTSISSTAKEMPSSSTRLPTPSLPAVTATSDRLTTTSLPAVTSTSDRLTTTSLPVSTATSDRLTTISMPVTSTSTYKRTQIQQRLDLEEKKLEALTRSAEAQEKIASALKLISTLLNKYIS